jgi:hypothetical protein
MPRLADRKQRGSVLLLVAVFLVGLLLLSALAIDLGILYTARTSAQHAADAAALAGAFTFLNPAAVEPDAAVDAAISTAAQNKILGQAVAIDAGNVVVDVTARKVRVTVPRLADNGIPLFFGRVTGKQKADVQAIATAQASDTATGSSCVKPIFIPNTALSTQPTVTDACNKGEVIFNDAGQVTSYAESLMGSQMNIRPSDPSQALAPGQFYSLDFGSGANTYRCTLGQCANDCDVDQAVVSCDNPGFPLKTGNMVGPTKQGISDLIGSPPDTWVSIGQYQTSVGLSDMSRSLAVAPVWDSCHQNVSPGYAGQQVKVIGFVELFFDGMPGNQVQAHLVNATSCSNSGGGGGSGTSSSAATGSNTGPFGIPVRLIQNDSQ